MIPVSIAYNETIITNLLEVSNPINTLLETSISDVARLNSNITHNDTYKDLEIDSLGNFNYPLYVHKSAYYEEPIKISSTNELLDQLSTIIKSKNKSSLSIYLEEPLVIISSSSKIEYINYPEPKPKIEYYHNCDIMANNINSCAGSPENLSSIYATRIYNVSQDLSLVIYIMMTRCHHYYLKLFITDVRYQSSTIYKDYLSNRDILLKSLEELDTDTYNKLSDHLFNSLYIISEDNSDTSDDSINESNTDTSDEDKGESDNNSNIEESIDNPGQ